MTMQEKVIKNKVGLLNLGKELQVDLDTWLIREYLIMDSFPRLPSGSRSVIRLGFPTVFLTL